MYQNMLPIGSVVQLKQTDKAIMLCGRVVGNTALNKVYDYVGCIYPEGVVDSSKLLFFNSEDIAECLFRGYENDEEKAFRSHVLDPLGEVVIEDGKMIARQKTIES